MHKDVIKIQPKYDILCLKKVINYLKLQLSFILFYYLYIMTLINEQTVNVS